jgi:YesN/AraC family two-component response regulator
VEFIADDLSSQQMAANSKFEEKLEELEKGQKESKDTILVVDDNKDMRQFLSGIFDKDYHVLTAENGEKAKKILKTKEIDIVVTDLMMPKVNGLQLIQWIKKNPETDFIPVILLTAKTAIESRLEALEYGADDYVTKPFEPEYLRARVHNILLQRKQLEQSYRQRLMRLESTKNDEDLPGDTFLAKLLNIMEKQLDNNTLTVDELVDEMGMGRTVFFNKLKSLTGLSPVEFIREVRIKRAAQLLESGRYNVTEITYMVGMNDSRYFAKCFKNAYGVTPTEYRKSLIQDEEKQTNE